MNKKKKDNSQSRKIIIEEVDTTVLRKVTGARPGGTSGASDANQCCCACGILNQDV